MSTIKLTRSEAEMLRGYRELPAYVANRIPIYQQYKVLLRNPGGQEHTHQFSFACPDRSVLMNVHADKSTRDHEVHQFNNNYRDCGWKLISVHLDRNSPIPISAKVRASWEAFMIAAGLYEFSDRIDNWKKMKCP